MTKKLHPDEKRMNALTRKGQGRTLAEDHELRELKARSGERRKERTRKAQAKLDAEREKENKRLAKADGKGFAKWLRATKGIATVEGGGLRMRETGAIWYPRGLHHFLGAQGRSVDVLKLAATVDRVGLKLSADYDGLKCAGGGRDPVVIPWVE